MISAIIKSLEDRVIINFEEKKGLEINKYVYFCFLTVFVFPEKFPNFPNFIVD